MRCYISIIILVLVFFSCEKEKDECNKDIITNTLIAGEGTLSFQRIIGSNCSGSNTFLSVIQTNDSGYIFCGNTESNAVDGFDVFVLKSDSKGKTDWFKFYSYIKYDYGIKAIKTKDEGFLILASSQPCFGWGAEYSCRMDLILLKFTSEGLLEWEKTLKLENYSNFIDINQTADNGYFIFYNQRITNNDGSEYFKSFYFITDDNGQILSEDETAIELIWDVAKTQDEGFIICGTNDGDDLSISRLNSQGDIIWTNTTNEYSHYSVSSITEISDGYAICGTHNIEAYVELAYILILDSEGNEIWIDDYLDNYDTQINYPNSDNSILRSFENIIATNDENFVVIGQNSDGFINSTAYLMKINPTTGVVIWQKTYSLGDLTVLYGIQNTADYGFILAGKTLNFIYGTSGNSEGFILKTDEYGN